MKPAWEVMLRRVIRLPKHSTANDGAVLLLRAAALVAIAAIIVVLFAPWFVGRLAVFTTSAFVGLALQQYTWYTGRIYSECWNDEGIPVLMTVGLSAVLLGVLSLLFSILLVGHGFLKIVLIGGVHFAILSSWRWAIWGSLFDVRHLAPSRSLATISPRALSPDTCESNRRCRLACCVFARAQGKDKLRDAKGAPVCVLSGRDAYKY